MKGVNINCYNPFSLIEYCSIFTNAETVREEVNKMLSCEIQDEMAFMCFVLWFN